MRDGLAKSDIFGPGIFPLRIYGGAGNAYQRKRANRLENAECNNLYVFLPAAKP